jgi:hypothetical protein
VAYQTGPSVSPTAFPKCSNLKSGDVASESPSFAASKVIYASISASHIRLITLHQGSSSGPLQYSLNEVSLEDPPRYGSLSYVWGSKADPDTVILSGQPFQVRRNLGELSSNCGHLQQIIHSHRLVHSHDVLYSHHCRYPSSTEEALQDEIEVK